nr:uncharacterized protein LOC112498001 [Ipomoea batatas]
MANVETSNATDNTNAQTSEARMLADRLEVRLNRLQDSAFQVANYYFVFQGPPSLTSLHSSQLQ